MIWHRCALSHAREIITYSPFCVALAVIVHCMLTAQDVQARDLQIQGAPGGGHFRSQCSNGYIVGVYLKTGGWVDSIGLKCASFNAAQRRFDQPPWNMPYHGGPGGSPKEGICPGGDRYASSIMFGYTHKDDRPVFADFVELTCTPLAGGAPNKICLDSGSGCTSVRVGGHYSGKLLHSFVQTCSENEAATGIHGRSGSYLDALGLACGPKPPILPTQASNTPSGKPLKALGKKTSKATAKEDVDIHEGPGGQFKIVGMMREGTTASVLGRHADGWLNLKLDVASGSGWVAADHLTTD